MADMCTGYCSTTATKPKKTKSEEREMKIVIVRINGCRFRSQSCQTDDFVGSITHTGIGDTREEALGRLLQSIAACNHERCDGQVVIDDQTKDLADRIAEKVLEPVELSRDPDHIASVIREMLDGPEPSEVFQTSKQCSSCDHLRVSSEEDPCLRCVITKPSNWEPKV